MLFRSPPKAVLLICVLYACNNTKMSKTAFGGLGGSPLGESLAQDQIFMNMQTGKQETLPEGVLLQEQPSQGSDRVFIVKSEDSQATDGADSTRYSLPRGITPNFTPVEDVSLQDDINNSMDELNGGAEKPAPEEGNTTPPQNQNQEQEEMQEGAEELAAVSSTGFPIKEV